MTATRTSQQVYGRSYGGSAPESYERYFVPAYMGVRGWVGIELSQVKDETLAGHIRDAWRLIAPKKLVLTDQAR